MNSGSSGTTWAWPGATMVAHTIVWKCSVGWPARVHLEQFGQWILVERWYSVPSSAISTCEPSRRNAAKPAGALERRNHLVEHGKEVIGRDRVEHGADVVVGRDTAHAEQRLAVRAPVAGLEPALKVQERRALDEEQREGAHADVGHGVAYVRSRALVREPRAAAPHRADQALEHLHAKVESDSTKP